MQITKAAEAESERRGRGGKYLPSEISEFLVDALKSHGGGWMRRKRQVGGGCRWRFLGWSERVRAVVK